MPETLKNYEDLLALIHSSERDYDMGLIWRAYQLAEESHHAQRRLSGSPYISHPLAVACILVELGMDTESVAAGLLHDVVEDTKISLEQLQKQFGQDVANLVDGVTKLGRIPYSSREEQQAENVRKMLIAMADDIRVIIIKLADRLHNMRTSEYWNPQKQRDKSLENMEVYAPIAHRLGIRAVKEELEDRSLRYLDPVAYHEIENGLEMRSSERKDFIQKTKQRIYDRIAPTVPNVYLTGRVKSINGIYRKMFMQGKSMDEIYDIYAVRIIVDTVDDCYGVFGIIHDMFRPIPNRFKDYISTPKPNMYQSLHTTVLSKEGIPFEVQIRTWEMHHTAEYGIAAHWKYKLGLAEGNGDSLEERLAWIRQILENEKDSEDATDLVRTIKSDLAPEEVFVFTPKGDVISLPVGSTVIDFAYAIHSAVGNRMVGAKVDKRIVSLDYKVKTGEIIEVLTTKEEGHGPSRDWLKIVKTSEARNKIKQWFKKERREENILVGRAELERELKRNGVELSGEELLELLTTIGRRQNCQTPDDVYSAIGYGGIQLWKVMPKIREFYFKIHRPPIDPESVIKRLPSPKKAVGGVIVDGMDNCLIKISRCCNPLPGDEIIGFITRGYGVSIHKRSCSNVPRKISGAPEPERWVSAHWVGEVKEDFKATLELVALDRPGLLADFTQQIFHMRIVIESLNSRQTKDGRAIITATITVNGKEHLQSVLEKLTHVSGAITVRRV